MNIVYKRPGNKTPNRRAFSPIDYRPLWSDDLGRTIIANRYSAAGYWNIYTDDTKLPDNIIVRIVRRIRLE